MTMFDVKDIYGLVNYFVPNYMVAITPAVVKIQDEFGVEEKITCWELSFINDKKIYISEEVRQSFMKTEHNQEQSSAPSGDSVLEE